MHLGEREKVRVERAMDARRGLWIGIDFGTTNSGAAVVEGDAVRALPLDPASRDPAVMPSVLYVTREHQVFLGQEAISTYYRQHVGRPSHMVREEIGEIEITLSDVGSVKGYPVGPQEIVRTVHTMVDALSPGRLLRSLKSALATSYEGTRIFDRSYTLEELIAAFLGGVRERAQAVTGRHVAGAVLGRPVHFTESRGEEDDRRAEARLRAAAIAAGFGEVRFELEPVAAAVHYAQGLERAANLLVFDLGGGTLDITVMRAGGGVQEVYAVGGLGIAGDTFDRRLMAGTVLDHFGRGSTYGPDQAPFPPRYTDALLDWQTLPELSRPAEMRFLRQAQRTSSDPRALRALESLLVRNAAAQLYDAVETAKMALSSAPFATITLRDKDLDLWQPVTRSQFEALIAEDQARIETVVHEVLGEAGLRPAQIDAVVRTGGSSQIPCLAQGLLERAFPGKVVQHAVFRGVAAGLAIRAAERRDRFSSERTSP
jgi:hypothetical chaperone protein